MNRSTFNDGFYFPHLGGPMGESTMRDFAAGRLWFGNVCWLCDNISLQLIKLRLEKLRQNPQTLEVYTYCVYGKTDGQSDGQTHFNCLLQLTSRGQKSVLRLPLLVFPSTLSVVPVSKSGPTKLWV